MARCDPFGRIVPQPQLGDAVNTQWDVVVVGAGHNGLTAAAYLARGGLRVVVVERNDRVGGACTLEQPFPDPQWRVSPCAYLVGLLHPLVVEELGLRRHGYRVHLVDPHLWCPFQDGTSLALWEDADRSAAAIAELAPGDEEGYRQYQQLFARIRAKLRAGERDFWVGDSPTRHELGEVLAGDQEAAEVVFESSIADVVERYIKDERIRTALHGQGIIGTYAGPREPGTAAVHLMHSLGCIEGVPGAWGYVEGGMGRVSFALADAALEAGATIVTGEPVSAVIPGTGVALESGGFLTSHLVVSNADPKRTLALCEDEGPESFRRRVDQWRSDSPVLKINCGLSHLPTFTAAAALAPTTGSPATAPHRAMVTISTGIETTQSACEASRRGIPSPAWCELYFQTAYDPSIAPAGRHSMSIFAQYVPAELDYGEWSDRRDAVADAAINEIARFAPDVEETIQFRQVLGPLDIQQRMALTGGHIFQGECLPDQMWDRRFSPRTPVPGLYLCGAATHPGGSVMAINGRNAAMAVLADRADGKSGRRSPS